MISNIRGIVVCVNYDDLLRITLPRNMRHLDECLVVTSPEDERTQEFVRSVPNCRLHITDAFYRHGAMFNKGLAMEEGFDILGREGWILIWDADTMLPEHLPEIQPQPLPMLYGVPRLILPDPKQYTDTLDWKTLETSADMEFPGYFQLFHADDPHVKDKRPWYDPSFVHAGGGDAYFQDLWPWNRRYRLQSFKVLHLGLRDKNWFGRVTERTDDLPNENVSVRRQWMEKLQSFMGWNRYANSPRRVHRFLDRIKLPDFVSRYVWHKSQPPK